MNNFVFPVAKENLKKAKYIEKTDHQGVAVDQQEDFYHPLITTDKLVYINLPKDYHIPFQLELPGSKGANKPSFYERSGYPPYAVHKEHSFPHRRSHSKPKRYKMGMNDYQI